MFSKWENMLAARFDEEFRGRKEAGVDFRHSVQEWSY